MLAEPKMPRVFYFAPAKQHLQTRKEQDKKKKSTMMDREPKWGWGEGMWNKTYPLGHLYLGWTMPGWRTLQGQVFSSPLQSIPAVLLPLKSP